MSDLFLLFSQNCGGSKEGNKNNSRGYFLELTKNSGVLKSLRVVH